MNYKLKDFTLLIVIFALVIAFTVAMQLVYGEGSFEFGMRMFMGAFFAIFGGFKLLNLRNFAMAYREYDLLAMRSKFYSYLYPFLEVGLAALYFANYGGLYRDVFTLVLMLFSALGVYLKVRKKEKIQCACLGMVFVLPMTWVTLIEDLLMAAEAGIMIWLAINGLF